MLTLRLSEVRDTGIGIAPRRNRTNCSRASAGRRLHHAALRRHGPGLAICKSLAELMAGVVGADYPGEGSTFQCRCRCAGGACARAATAPGSATLARVLVVDDNAHTATVLAEMLRPWRSRHAQRRGTGTVGTERRQQRGQPYDLVVLDWQMPGMDGLELGDRIGEPGTAAAAALRDGHRLWRKTCARRSTRH